MSLLLVFYVVSFFSSDGGNSFQSQGTVLIDLVPEDSEYQSVMEQVTSFSPNLLSDSKMTVANSVWGHSMSKASCGAQNLSHMGYLPLYA